MSGPATTSDPYRLRSPVGLNWSSPIGLPFRAASHQRTIPAGEQSAPPAHRGAYGPAALLVTLANAASTLKTDCRATGLVAPNDTHARWSDLSGFDTSFVLPGRALGASVDGSSSSPLIAYEQTYGNLPGAMDATLSVRRRGWTTGSCGGSPANDVTYDYLYLQVWIAGADFTDDKLADYHQYEVLLAWAGFGSITIQSGINVPYIHFSAGDFLGDTATQSNSDSGGLQGTLADMTIRPLHAADFAA